MEYLVGVVLILAVGWQCPKVINFFQHKTELKQLRKDNRILQERNLNERSHITNLNIARTAKRLSKSAISRRAS